MVGVLLWLDLGKEIGRINGKDTLLDLLAERIRLICRVRFGIGLGFSLFEKFHLRYTDRRVCILRNIIDFFNLLIGSLGGIYRLF